MKMLTRWISRLAFFILARMIGGIEMVDIYVALIIHGRREFQSVPVNLQPAVEQELNALGLGTDGKPLTETN